MIKLLILSLFIMAVIVFFLFILVIVLVQNNRNLSRSIKNLKAYVKGVGIMEGNIYE